MEKIKVLVGWADKNYSACTDDYDNLNGVVVATNKTIEGLKKELESALEFHIEGCLSDGDAVPEWLVSRQYKLDYILQTSALLHKLDGILTRSAIARATGINERQIGHYASGFRNPRPAQREKIINGIHSISRELASVV
jgi:predicted RNase H-like HicB family nuclease